MKRSSLIFVLVLVFLGLGAQWQVSPRSSLSTSLPTSLPTSTGSHDDVIFNIPANADFVYFTSADDADTTCSAMGWDYTYIEDDTLCDDRRFNGIGSNYRVFESDSITHVNTEAYEVIADVEYVADNVASDSNHEGIA